MKVESESEVPQSSLTLHDAMDFSLPGSFVHGIFQARVLEWVAIAFSALFPLELANGQAPLPRGSLTAFQYMVKTPCLEFLGQLLIVLVSES